MPTNVTGLRSARPKSQTAAFDWGAAVPLLALAFLVGGLVLLSFLFGLPDLSETAQLVGP
jgi:hypothetical protein